MFSVPWISYGVHEDVNKDIRGFNLSCGERDVNTGFKKQSRMNIVAFNADLKKRLNRFCPVVQYYGGMFFGLYAMISK